ncbi:MAG: amidohydrolase [Desulfobacterales bacterium]|nr:amidohydrolase [Desulfobacterales bacterium]
MSTMNISLEKEREALPEDRAVVPVVDMHLHYVDFLQHTDSFETHRDLESGRAVTGLVKAMEDGNISRNLVFGLPVKKKWEWFEPRSPHYYLSDNSRCIHWPSTDEMVAQDYMKLSREVQGRIAPTLAGFDPTDCFAVDYVQAMFHKYPFWKGVGEVLLRHDDLTNLTLGEIPRANHPALFPIYDFCADKQVPICLHQNSTSVGSVLTRKGNDPYIYLHELEEALEKFPQTTFVWAHCGVSRRVIHPEYHRMLIGMMQQYPNLHLDLSWLVYENCVCEPRKDKTSPLVPKDVWILEVIEPYADRIMLGSDLCGHFSTLGKTMARYNLLLRALSDTARDQVARINAERLYFPESVLPEL